MRILIIEDEWKVAKALQEGLEREKYVVTVAGDGEEGFFQLFERPFDLVLLDLNLPGRDGMDVLRTMRQRGLQIPVIILSARDALSSKVAGLETGADDYLVKPFAFPELLARIRSVARRGAADPDTKLSIADLGVDLVGRKVMRGDRTIALTVKEFDLLGFFIRNKHRVIPRDMLAREVWGDVGRATALDNVIDVHMAHLRRKIDDPFPVKLLHTLRGVGFMLTDRKP